MEFKIIIQGRFRSSERRRRELACWGYKHGTAQVSRLTVVVPRTGRLKCGLSEQPLRKYLGSQSLAELLQ